MIVLASLSMFVLAQSGGPVELPGTWNVTMTVNYSTCKGTNVGDVKAEQWNFNVEGGNLKVVVAGQSQTTPAYLGAETPDGSIRLRAGPGTGVELKLSGRKLVGRRVHANPLTLQDACAIIYDVKATKAN